MFMVLAWDWKAGGASVAEAGPNREQRRAHAGPVDKVPENAIILCTQGMVCVHLPWMMGWTLLVGVGRYMCGSYNLGPASMVRVRKRFPILLHVALHIELCGESDFPSVRYPAILLQSVE